MSRKTLATFGPKGRTVRVFVEGDLVRVQWREAGLLRTKSWANTTSNRVDAKAWARGFSEAREAAPGLTAQRVTLRALWDAYKLAEFHHLRARTQQIYSDGWRHWEETWGREFIAEDATPEMLDKLRAEMERIGLAVNTTRMTIRAVKMVHAFGLRRELLHRDRLASWRFKLAKEKRPTPPAEYRGDEFAKLLGALDPAKGTQWRAFVALSICGYQGARQHAVLHLRWEDVDLEAGVIHWRAEWDKVGRAWTQPIREGTRAALQIAQDRTNGTGWVLPSAKVPGQPYTIQSLWWMLRETSKRAGVAIVKGRAGHGLRRMVAGDVNAATGDVALALQAIGDTSLQMAPRYVQTRQDRIAEAFSALDRNATATGKENAPAATGADSQNLNSDNDL